MSVNENQIPIYVLQPEISGQIKQTTLEEIKIWINDGELQPHHQVRIRNLSWVEARNVPSFKSLFESKKNDETEQPDHFSEQPLPAASAFPQNRSEINKATASSNETSVSTAEKKESKPAEPSAVFKAYEKKALAKSKQTESKNAPTEPKKATPKFSPEQPKKSPVIKKTLGFLAGCVLMLLLSSGGSYLWVYQLKTPVEINGKNLPELAGLEHKLTSEKLDLRLKEANNQENLSRQIAQLEKKYDAQRKTVVENHRIKLADADFTATFSYSSVALLALFFIGRIFYGKNSNPVEQPSSSKSPAPKSSKRAVSEETNIENVEDEISEDIDMEDSSEENIDSSAEARPSKSPGKKEISGEISDIDEVTNSEQSQTAAKCLLHPDKSSAFVCEDCDNNYCDDCLKNFGELENCCPFCKVVCKSLEANKDEKSKKKENKPVNLLDLNKGNSEFIVYEYEEERSKTAGVIQAFVVALLLSAAIAILWTYKINPYLENRNKETVQNVSPNNTENAEQIPLNANPATYNKEIDDALKTGHCIDPETKKPFECDEESRRALYEHTRKTRSVEKAKKDVLNTAELMSGSKDGNKEPDDPQIAAAKAEQNKKETRQLTLSFIISFVLIFGSLLATVFSSKDKKTFLNQNKGEEAGEDFEENSEEEIFEEKKEETAEEETE